MGIVCNSNLIGSAVPCYAVDTRNFTTPNTVYPHLTVGNRRATLLCSVRVRKHAKFPSLKPVNFGHQFFGKRNACTARVVSFVYMVYLFYRWRVIFKVVHDTCKISVYRPEDSYTETKIATPKECLSFLGT